MKFLKGVMLLILISILWGTSSLLKAHQLNQLVDTGKIPYGPIPNVAENYYSYDGLQLAFNSNLELKRANEFTKLEFENLILESLNPIEKQNFQKYLSPTLDLSVDYQVDPFWIIAVMMAESRFNFEALSPKNARGLMQIKPDTASHLYQLMKKKVSAEQVEANLYRPEENIEVGIFYLKKLLQNFRMDYRLATIAYNVGPSKLRNLLNADEMRAINSSYLSKVHENYKDLTKNFAQALRKRLRPYEMTYVLRDTGVLISSENLSMVSSHSLLF